MTLEEHHWKPPGGVWTSENMPSHLAAMKAAWERHRADYTRVYTRRGMVAHLSPNWRGTKAALCPVVPAWPGEWLGTGSQGEYELAAEMLTCKRCYEAFALSVECGNPECPCHSPALTGMRFAAGDDR